ncbi:alpha/beta hydrolase [Paractinoplanes deccanensis]|uniref:Alpha/beta hydrolase n=1 Tax=Paractinoplanes deccanensis TaxID=113561 RepID=A0ABQ3YAM7_9ACTN|nr:alpha/beta hydrolase [Actinoplanes deccanensis]GID77011.1 alpha/beta hydrolase [Actinoplanes deccanensis]
MSDATEPVVVLVHGAFAESASWDGVVDRLTAEGVRVVAVANPLRGLLSDAAYVRDVIASLGGPVVLAGHSYGGSVITQAAGDNAAVKALVYVSAFAPENGESALELSGKFPGSTLGDAVVSRPLSSGGSELSIDQAKFAHQFAADVDPAVAARMAVAQRPVTEEALTAGLAAGTPAWRSLPSWFVWGGADLNIPAEALRFMAERAQGRGLREIPGAGHALPVSQPGPVAETILQAVRA